MKKNMGNADRMIRLVVAAVLILLYLNGVAVDTAGVIALALAGIFILTSIAGVCPLYSLFRLNTIGKK